MSCLNAMKQNPEPDSINKTENKVRPLARSLQLERRDEEALKGRRKRSEAFGTNARASSEEAPSEPDALPPACAEDSFAASYAAGVRGRRCLISGGGGGVRVVFSRTREDFVRQHGEVKAEAIVHLPVLLPSLADGVGREAAVPAERAEAAFAAAALQLGLVHSG